MASLLWILIIHLVVFNFPHECICLKLKISFNKKSALRFFPQQFSTPLLRPSVVNWKFRSATRVKLSVLFVRFVLILGWVPVANTWVPFHLPVLHPRFGVSVEPQQFLAATPTRQTAKCKEKERETVKKWKSPNKSADDRLPRIVVLAVVYGIFAFVLMPLRLDPETGARARMRTSWTRCLLSLKSTCNLQASGCGLRPHRHPPPHTPWLSSHPLSIYVADADAPLLWCCDGGCASA